MKHVHLTHCLVGMAIAVGLLLSLGVRGGTIVAVGAALLCPLMMVFCMGHLFRRGTAPSHNAGTDREQTPRAA